MAVQRAPGDTCARVDIPDGATCYVPLLLDGELLAKLLAKLMANMSELPACAALWLQGR